MANLKLVKTSLKFLTDLVSAFDISRNMYWFPIETQGEALSWQEKTGLIYIKLSKLNRISLTFMKKLKFIFYSTSVFQPIFSQFSGNPYQSTLDCYGS